MCEKLANSFLLFLFEFPSMTVFVAKQKWEENFVACKLREQYRLELG